MSKVYQEEDYFAVLYIHDLCLSVMGTSHCLRSIVVIWTKTMTSERVVVYLNSTAIVN